MGHRLNSSLFAAALISSICVIGAPVFGVGNEALAGPKSSKSSEARTKPRDGAKPAPPAPPAVKRVAVCVRPKDVDEKIKEWTFSETNRPVVENVEATAKRLGNRIYYFDAKADLDSPQSQPASHRFVKCPNDKRKPEEAAPTAAKEPGILGPSGPLFASANPLGRSSLASSGTGKTTTTLVNQFVTTAADFSISANADETQASQFAERLRDAITNSRSFPEFFSSDLTPNAADILVNHFGESISAALADRSAIGPLQVMKKFAPSGKNAKWNSLPLVSSELMEDKEIIEPNEVPAVILSTADYQHRKGIVAAEVPWAMPVASLRGAYKKAYADKPQWMSAIDAYLK
jgi:hypothetical protein